MFEIYLQFYNSSESLSYCKDTCFSFCCFFSNFANRFLSTFTEDQLHQYDLLINKPNNDWDIFNWATGLYSSLKVHRHLWTKIKIAAIPVQIHPRLNILQLFFNSSLIYESASVIMHISDVKGGKIDRNFLLEAFVCTLG